MLVELSITPLNGNTHISEDIADILEIIRNSDLRHELTPTGTCIEGEWDEVMPVVKRCHEEAKDRSSHVITHIKIEDDEGETNKIEQNITSVKEKL